MADISDLDIQQLTRIMGEIVGERVRQVTVHDRTQAVDDGRTLVEWSWILLRRVTDLAHPWGDAHIDARRELLEIATVAVAAIEAHDRRPQRDPDVFEIRDGTGHVLCDGSAPCTIHRLATGPHPVNAPR